MLDGDGHFQPMEDWSTHIDGQMVKSDFGDIVTDAIDALPADYRTALVLHDVENLSKPEIAAIIGVDLSCVTRRVLWCLLPCVADDRRRDEAVSIIGNHSDDADPFTRPHEGVLALPKLAEVEVHGLARARHRQEVLPYDRIGGWASRLV
jgi:hypothetical protein